MRKSVEKKCRRVPAPAPPAMIRRRIRSAPDAISARSDKFAPPRVDSARPGASAPDELLTGYASFGTEGCLRDIDPRGARILGKPRGELIGRPLLTLIAKADRRKWLAHLKQLRAGRVQSSTDLRLVPQKGEPPRRVHLSTVRTSAEGELQFERGPILRTSIAAFASLAKRAQAASVVQTRQEELRRSEHFNQAILDSLPAQVAVLDRDATVVAANEPWRRFMPGTCSCLEQRVAVGGNYLAACRRAAAKGDALAKETLEQMEAVLAGRLVEFSREYPCHLPDRRRWFLAQMVRSPEEVGRVIVSHSEITAQKLAEDVVRRDRAQLEILVAERTAELHRIHRELRAEMAERVLLQDRILAVGEQERRRIGQDLHDGLCQLLTAIRLKMDLLKKRLAQRSPGHVRSVHFIQELLAQAVAEARSLARGLQPVEDTPDGLRVSLQHLADSTYRLYGVQCRYAASGRGAVPDHAVAVDLFWIAQEAVTNAVRHARPKLIAISLVQSARYVILTVSNDGRRFRKRSRKPGMGLKIMSYRAERIGAKLEISPDVDQGTTVRCTLPLNAPAIPAPENRLSASSQ